MSSSPPTTLGKYQIIREIARSNDIVYEAYDPAMNRRVALKELAVPSGSTASQKEERLKRFQREAKAAGSLAHPNIVTVYEVGEDSNRNYIAMEFLDGRTLRNEIDTRGFLPQDRAIEIATDMLCGLDFAHTHGVIHRDIKPENIQILENGTVKLTDFGIARLTFEPNLTMDGQVFGTPSYMSPEQVVGREIDLRSDLFSVGVVLYEMLSGTKPFVGDSVVSIAMAISNTVLSCPNQIGFSVWQVLEKVLDKSPAMRFGTAKEFIDALHQAGRPDVVQAPMNYGSPPAGNATMMPGTPGAGYNPYAPPQVGPSFIPPPPQQPMPQYGYQAPYGQQPYPQPTGFVPYGQPVPVYYPPPPRQPLFKPATKRFFGRLFLTFAILGTFVALVFVGINALSRAINEASLQKKDRDRQSVQRPAGSGLDGQIRDQEKQVDEMQSKAGRDEAARKLAEYYTAKARASTNPVESAEWLDKAIEADKDNPQRYAALADLLVQRAQQTSKERTEDYKQLMATAADRYLDAAKLAMSNQDQIGWREKAARCYRAIAMEIAPTDRSGARDKLYEARKLTEMGSPLRTEIELAILKLSL